MIIKKLSDTSNVQAGMVLPMALILLVVASIIIVPGLWAMQSFMTINRDVEQDTMAYYAADAGVADYIWKFKPGTPPLVNVGDSYQLTGINGMDVSLTLKSKKDISGGYNYIIESSAPPAPNGKAVVMVMVNQGGAQGSDIFDKAVASLDGSIIVDWSCVIKSDDVLEIHNCDSNWAKVPTTVSCGTSTAAGTYASGLPYDTSKSAKMTMTSATAGNLAYKNLSAAMDISTYQYIKLWIRSNATLNAGDLVFKLATMNNLSGITESISIPALPAGTGTRLLLTISNPSNFTGLQSIGIAQAVAGPKSNIVYVDSVIATNNISDGDIYASANSLANGQVSVNGTIWGNAQATGTIYDNPSGGGIWGTQTPSAPQFVPQPIPVNSYIAQAMAGTHYSAPPGYGTIYIGPGYYTGDVTFGGSLQVYLQGPIYSSGKLTIGNSCVVSGPYPIVANSIEISGDARAQLAKELVPFIIAQSGDISVSGSSAVSGILYAPNGTIEITGGTPTPPGYNVYGAVVGKNVLLDGSTTVKYMTGIRTLPWLPGPGTGGMTTTTGYDYR